MSAEKIRALNDEFRRTFHGGKVMMTSGINALADGVKARVLEKVRTFDAFSRDNDPHQEHDFGAFEEGGYKVFFKLDYYDAAMEFGSEDPADPSTTTRVLTIMLASEY
jgi:Protein of unknown function (DUF3768)